MKEIPKRFPYRHLPSLAALIVLGIVSYGLGYWQGSRSESKPLEQPPESVSRELDPVVRSPQPLLEESSRPLAQSAEPNPTIARNGQAAGSRESGYNDAKTDLEAALAQAQSMNPREQAYYVAGIFKYIAENSSPRDALTIASAQEGTTRSFALKGLVANWLIKNDMPEDQRENRQRRVLGLSGGHFGLEAELASVLSRDEIDPSIKKAWIETFPKHPSRSEIVARLSPSFPDFDPNQALAQSEGWTEWEKSRFASSLIRNWSNENPKDAWDWYNRNPDSLPSETASQILGTWAREDTNALIQSLDTMEDLAARHQAIEAISASLATQGTDKALDWVDTLDPGDERDRALQAIYENTPKGIGAVLKVENGFPQIADIMPSGALATTDLQPGDLIVQSRDAGSDPQDLYGKDLRDIVGLLRGPPGSEVEIRVLRENGDTGQLEEHSATVVRDLLILDSSDRN